MSLNRVFRVFTILVVALLIPPMARAQQGEATDRINSFHASILEVMRQAEQRAAASNRDRPAGAASRCRVRAGE